MAKITETELQKRLRKLEAAISDPSDTVALTDDQYTLTENVIYVAYASALSNLTDGTIPNQSDATDFQYSPYNIAGVLMAYRGYFSSTSIYPSGDPTDYLWESTTGLTGFESSERYSTTSTGFRKSLGNPTEPGDGITWTVISPGAAVPGTAIWLAERYTVSGITSGWSITSVAAYIDTSLLIDDSVTTAKIVNNAVTADKVIANAITTAKINADAITAAKIAAGTITTTEIAASTITSSNISSYGLTAANATVENAMFGTLTLAGNSITQPVTYSATGIISAAKDVWFDAATITINNTDSAGTTSNLVSFSVFGYYTSGGDWQMEFELFRGVTKIDEGQVAMINNTAGTIVSSFAVDTSGAGENTYTLKVRGTGDILSDVYAKLRKMYVLGAKR